MALERLLSHPTLTGETPNYNAAGFKEAYDLLTAKIKTMKEKRQTHKTGEPHSRSRIKEIFTSHKGLRK